MGLEDMDIFGNTSAKKMPKHLFFTANHVDFESAIKAETEKQNCSICPRYWYADATIKCLQCKVNFVFSKEEQKYWYEELKFWVDSFPNKCPSCKKNEKRLHNEFSYLRNHWFKPDKQEKVIDKLDKIIQTYGFVPWDIRDLNEKVRQGDTSR